MQENYLYEYAVIRVVPRVEREEFLNVGVILYSRRPKFLEVMYTINEERLRAFGTIPDIEELESHLAAFKRIGDGAPGSGPIGALDAASRFRWLTATRSTIVQASRVHPGLCINPAETLRMLFSQLVL